MYLPLYLQKSLQGLMSPDNRMEIGFVSFNQEALNRGGRVMTLLQGQGAIDELGLGRIRDAFSNTMFPGMSTLQTRAKYFLLMPALFAFLERTRIRDAREARMLVREYEISLTRRLLEGTPKEEEKGIIGGESVKKGEDYVKYDPAYIYGAGLETYGLVRSGGNIYRMIAERSFTYQNLPKKLRESEMGDGDADELHGIQPIFVTCGENYDFRSKDPLSISLTFKEADFLKRQIVSHTRGSMLGYLLDSGLYKKISGYDFETLEKPLKGNVPEQLFETYILARRYARFAYLLRLRYAMLYDIAVGAEKVREEESNFFEYFSTHRDEFTIEAIDEILRFVSGRVTEESCKIFCRKAVRLLNEEDWDELDRLIVRREVEIKTAKRSKLLNAKEYEPGKPFEPAPLMSFRWDTIVRRVLGEIKEGLKDE